MGRRAVLGSLAVVLLAALAVGGHFGPRWVVDRLARGLREESGIELVVGRVHWQGVGARLVEVELAHPKRGLRARAASIDAAIRPLGLLTREGLYRRLEIEGLRVRIEPREPAISAGEPETDGAADTTDARTGRLARALDVLGARFERLTRSLAPGGTLIFRDLEVRSATAAGTELLLREGTVELTRVEAGGVRTAGAAATELGGRVTWSFRIPAERRRTTGTVVLDRVPLALLTPALPPLPWHRPAETPVEAELTIAERAAQRLEVAGRLRVEGLGLDSKRIAPAPIRGLALVVESHGSWLPDSSVLHVDSGAVHVNGLRTAFGGDLGWDPPHYLARLDARLPATSGSTLLASIPDGLLGELSGLQLDGWLSGRITLALDSRRLDATDLSLAFHDRVAFVGVPAALDVARFRQPFVHVVEDDRAAITTGPGTESWAPIERVSPYFLHAVLAHEDAGFFRHRGFADYAIEEALERNLERRRFAYGASTISMQLAKNLWLTRDKTISRKLREVLLTWWLEKAMSKREILELYVNVIEYGPSIYGVREAARRHFDREPAALTLAQSAYLATVLPSPKTFHRRDFTSGGLSEFTRGQMEFLVRHMARRGRVTEAAAERAQAEIAAFAFGSGAADENAWRPGDTEPLPFGFEPGEADIEPDEAGVEPEPRLSPRSSSRRSAAGDRSPPSR